MNKDGLTAFLLGLGVGVGIGMLFAPKSGSETRELIKSKAGEGTEFLKAKSGELVDKSKEVLSRQKDTLAEAVEAGRQAYRDAVGGEA